MIGEVLVIVVLIIVAVIALAVVYWRALLKRYPVPNYADAIHTIKTDDLWQIRLHRRNAAGGKGEPIFFMHSLASNHLNFEIPHGYSLVDYLSKAGYDCWTLDSRACRDAVPRRPELKYTATIDEVLTQDIPAGFQYIRAITGYERVHWIGHSMGGMMLYAHDARTGGEGLASAVTLGSPPGFKGYEHTSHAAVVFINKYAHGLFSNVFRGLAPYYDIWRPTSRLIPINWDNVHPKLRARELFYAAEMPFPVIGAQMDKWASGEPWVMCDGTVDVDAHLPKLKTPLFAIFGGIDPFVSAARASAFFDAIENPDKRAITLSRANGNYANYSHIELPFSIEGETEVFAPILAWLQQHPAAGIPMASEVVEASSPAPRKRAPRAKREDVVVSTAQNVHLSASSERVERRASSRRVTPAKAKPTARTATPKAKQSTSAKSKKKPR